MNEIVDSAALLAMLAIALSPIALILAALIKYVFGDRA